MQNTILIGTAIAASLPAAPPRDTAQAAAQQQLESFAKALMLDTLRHVSPSIAAKQGIAMTVADRIRVQNVRLLSDNHYILKTTTFEWRRANGEWQTQHRETYDRGNGATLLPYSLSQRSVVLVRQFR